MKHRDQVDELVRAARLEEPAPVTLDELLAGELAMGCTNCGGHAWVADYGRLVASCLGCGTSLPLAFPSKNVEVQER